MKKIVCELCESTDFVKDGGTFVCQGCGTKYTVDETKAMMKEVESDAFPTSVTGAPSVNPNQQQIDNLSVLANNAYEAGNNQEAEDFCNRIIELDVTCYKAWFLKGQAIGWQSTYGSPRVIEGANAMHKAVDFAPEEEKEIVAKQGVRELCRICDALASLAKKNFSDNPTDDNRLKFGEFLGLCDKVTDMFCDVSEDVKQFATDEYIECKRQSARYMNIAGVAALTTARREWYEVQTPNGDSCSTYLNWCKEIQLIFEDSINWGKSVDEDDRDIATRYKNLDIAWREPIGMKVYHWDGFTGMWVPKQYLAKEAERERLELAVEARINAAEFEKSGRIKAYWEAHKEEKEKLQLEGKTLLNKVDDLKAQIADLDKQIKDVEAVLLPFEAEEVKLHKQVKELEMRREKLGLFAGKEKKQIAEEIADLEAKISIVKAKAQEEKKAKSVEAKVAPLKTQKDEINKELSGIEKRISDIDAELSRDPEE